MTQKNEQASNSFGHSLSELMPQDEIAKRILSERAKSLAIPITDKTLNYQIQHYVRFKLGDSEFYGVPFQYIKEVMLNVTPTKVPNTPAWVAGIINRHGSLLTILNLKPFFHIHASDASQETHMIVVQTNRITCALQTNTIEGSDTYDHKTLNTSLATENAINPKYIIGLHHGVTAILNIEALLSDPRLNMSSMKEKK